MLYFFNILVVYLVEKGANMELPNRHGHTPLMIAAFKVRPDIARFLISHGADPSRTSIKGCCLLESCVSKQWKKLHYCHLSMGKYERTNCS